MICPVEILFVEIELSRAFIPINVSDRTVEELTVRAYRVLTVICPVEIMFVETTLNVALDIPSNDRKERTLR